MRGLDFASGGLSIAYRASPDPQDLLVEVATQGPPVKPMAHWCMRALVDTINSGGAGGAVFAPAQGAAERLTGPWEDAEAMGTQHTWTVRVAGVAPLFMRCFVEELRRAGMDQRCVGMRIAGSLPLDQSPMSVRDGDVRRWLDDPTAYLERWPSPGFEVDTNGISRGADLRVVLADPITPATRAPLEALSVAWLNAIRNYPGEGTGSDVQLNPPTMLPYFGNSKTEFRAHYQEFLYAQGPSKAMLVNLLARYHAKVSPIRKAEIRM